MLSAQAVGLAVTVAKGLIKLTGRIDIVLAEKEAVQANLVLPLPVDIVEPDVDTMFDMLSTLLKDTEEDPDPLGEDRNKIEDALTNNHTNLYFSFIKIYLPEDANVTNFDLNSDFMKELRRFHPELADDPDKRMAALYIGSGKDTRNKDYTWRIALTVVDVVSEFGSENVGLFIRDEKIQSVVGSVLKRFGEADLQKTDATGDLLKTALSATINGVLDAKDSIDIDDKWIGALFDAVVKARESVPENERDNFILGLFNGKGYPVLVSSLLTSGANLLQDDQENFKDIAEAFLNKVAELVSEQSDLENFFNDHWGDILRAGFKSVAEHGHVIVPKDTPILKDAVVAVAETLAKTPDKEFLSSDMIVSIVDATISAAAANSDQIDSIINDEWLSTLINSVVSTISETGIKSTLSKEGLEKLTLDALAVFAKNPELIIKNPGLTQELVKGILASLSSVDKFSAQELASATIEGALTAISDNPELLKFKYSEVVSTLAGKVGQLVKEHTISKIQGQDILRTITESIAENPKLFLDVEEKLSEWILGAVGKVAKKDEGTLIAGSLLTNVVNELVKKLAKTGKAAIENHPGEELIDPIEKVLTATLEKAKEELGKNISNQDLPKILSGMVSAWAKGDFSDADVTNTDFLNTFSELVKEAA